jgi:hypothetical protein
MSDRKAFCNSMAEQKSRLDEYSKIFEDGPAVLKMSFGDRIGLEMQRMKQVKLKSKTVA